MSNVLRLAIVDPNDSTRELLKRQLLGMEMVWLEAECSRYDFFADVVQQTSPDIGVVEIDGDSDKALDLVENLTLTSPDCAILVVSSSTDGNLILRALRAGAKEFLSQPIKIEDLVTALGRISDRRSGNDTKKKRSTEVFAFIGASGGVGTTTTAVNVGCNWAGDESRNVALLDLDFCLGDADVLLDSIPEYTLLDVAQNVTRLDISLLKRSMTRHASGLYLLPRPPQLEDIDRIVEEDMRRVIGLMKASFSQVVLDLSKGFTPIDMAAMELATKVVVMIQLDLACLRNVVRILASLDSISAIRDKIHVVVNHAGRDGNQISTKKIEETLGREIYWEIPHNQRVAQESREQGIPFCESAPKANLTSSLQEFSDKLLGVIPEAEASGSSGLGWFKNLLPSGKSGS